MKRMIYFIFLFGSVELEEIIDIPGDKELNIAGVF
jgi:hypothetical protein